MSLLVRNLDDRRWADLVDEARALIPVYAPEWTDHNIHDPGITFIELLAWIAEGDIYRINRIPDAHRRRFLELMGVRPLPPRPARGTIAVRLAAGSPPTLLPSGTELAVAAADGDAVAFRTVEPVVAVAGRIAAVLSAQDDGLADLTDMWRRGESIKPFGVDPRPGALFYLGFDFPHPLPADATLSVAFVTADARSDEHARLIEAERQAKDGCRPMRPNPCVAPSPETTTNDEREHDSEEISALRHDDVRLAWEMRINGQWQAVGGDAAIDHTRAFTLDGHVLLKVPSGSEPLLLPETEHALTYMRVRLLRGAYDKAPELAAFDLNGIAVEQAFQAGMLSWTVDPAADIVGPAPEKGATNRLNLRFADDGAASWIQVGGADGARFFVLDYLAPAGDQPGLLSIAAERVGTGNGLPQQGGDLTAPAIAADTLKVVTVEPHGLVRWRARADLLASGRTDAHVAVNGDTGVIAFGDGEHGRVPPKGAGILAAYRATLGERGNLSNPAMPTIAQASVNVALMTDVETVRSRVEHVSWIVMPAGGAMAETTDQAVGRVLEGLEHGDRAVTLADYERLALETPGTRIARAVARANTHPAFPCLRAPGVITLIVVPFLPLGRPVPSLALRRRVGAHLARRRLIGSRVIVAPPVYVDVAVTARVRARAGTNRTALAERVRASLDRFFDPLVGGAEGKGWPLGRDIYRSEVLQVIDGTDGADHVLELVLVDSSGTASCGNLCVPANGLVATGAHRIEVV